MLSTLRKWTGRTVVALIACLVMSSMLVAGAAATEFWQQKAIRFSAVAGETLAIGDAACIYESDGKAYLADANDSTLRPCIGVVGKGGAAGATVEIVVVGKLAGQTAASSGYRLFLSETAGELTITAPTNAQALGWVLPNTTSPGAATEYFISIDTPTSAGAAY